MPPGTSSCLHTLRHLAIEHARLSCQAALSLKAERPVREAEKRLHGTIWGGLWTTFRWPASWRQRRASKEDHVGFGVECWQMQYVAAKSFFPMHSEVGRCWQFPLILDAFAI